MPVMTTGCFSSIRKGSNSVKEVARVYLSSNGKELWIYDGNDNLISVTVAGESINTENFGIDVMTAVSNTLGESE
jgi:hypothetical protein